MSGGDEDINDVQQGTAESGVRSGVLDCVLEWRGEAAGGEAGVGNL
jgi:hypothetical protein